MLIAEDIADHKRLLQMTQNVKWVGAHRGIWFGEELLLKANQATAADIDLAVAARNSLQDYIDALQDRDNRIKDLESKLVAALSMLREITTGNAKQHSCLDEEGGFG